MQKSSHWYKATGEPCHTVATKSKTAKYPTRPVKITDAIELGLFPSVTTILSILDKPALSDWKNEQVAAAALRFVRRTIIFDPTQAIPAPQAADIALLRDEQPEGDAILVERIIEDAFRQVEQAADAGTIIHEGCELALQGLDYDLDKPVFLPELQKEFPLKTFIGPVVEFVRANEITITANEHRVVNLDEGYAGTMDAPMRSKRGIGVLDFKTRKTRPGKPAFAYDEQPMQIAAYHVAHYKSVPEPDSHVAGCNLFISTTEPGRVEPVWHDAHTIGQEWEAFRHLCGYWRIRRGYDPRPKN